MRVNFSDLQNENPSYLTSTLIIRQFQSVMQYSFQWDLWHDSFHFCPCCFERVELHLRGDIQLELKMCFVDLLSLALPPSLPLHWLTATNKWYLKSPLSHFASYSKFLDIRLICHAPPRNILISTQILIWVKSQKKCPSALLWRFSGKV